MARMMASGARAFRLSSVASAPVRRSTPAFRHLTMRERMASLSWPLPVGKEAMRKLPPSSLPFSSRVTWWPRRAEIQAA